MNLQEAIKRAKSNGWIKGKAEFAQEIWTNSSRKSAYMNLLNLTSGKSVKIDTDKVALICSKLRITADYLFGISSEPDERVAKDAFKASMLEKANEIITATNNY